IRLSSLSDAEVHARTDVARAHEVRIFGFRRVGRVVTTVLDHAVTLVEHAARLGFRREDRAELVSAADGWLAGPGNRAALADRTDRVRAGIGDLTVSGADP